MSSIPKFNSSQERTEWLAAQYKDANMMEDDKKILRYERLGIENKERMADPEFRAEWYESHATAISTDLWKKNNRSGKEAWWSSLSPAEQQAYTKQRLDNVAETNISFESKEQALEIFNKCWGEDRGEILYQELANEYGVAFGAIISLVRGIVKSPNNVIAHKYCPVSIETLVTMKEDWCKKYQPIIVVETYGSNRLAEYDALYKSKSNYNKLSAIKQSMTPSVAYHCMHNLEDTSLKSIIEYCDSVNVPRPKINWDTRSYKELATRWIWLKKDIQSERYEFKNYREAGDFLTSHIENKDGIVHNSQSFHEKIKTGITWKNEHSFGGWTYTKMT